MTRFLINLSDAALADRLLKIEAMGRETAARIAKGERGNGQGSPVMVRGRWQVSSSLQTSLNVQRSAWKQTKEEMNLRGM